MKRRGTNKIFSKYLLMYQTLPYPLYFFKYLPDHLHNHPEVFSILIFIYFDQENQGRENFTLPKLY